MTHHDQTTIHHTLALYDAGTPLPEVARRLLVPETTVRTWIKQARGPLGPANRAAPGYDPRENEAGLAAAAAALDGTSSAEATGAAPAEVVALAQN